MTAFNAKIKQNLSVTFTRIEQERDIGALHAIVPSALFSILLRLSLFDGSHNPMTTKIESCDNFATDKKTRNFVIINFVYIF